MINNERAYYMLQINQLKIPVEEIAPLTDGCIKTVSEMQKELNTIQKKVCRQLHIAPETIIELKIAKKSLDARKKPQLFWVYSVCIKMSSTSLEQKILKKSKSSDVMLYKETPYDFAISGTKKMNHPPIIIGMGPAGLFAGYMLAKAGFCPVIYERGKKVEERIQDVEEFWKNGKLLLHSNVQFGEGGAGTFSDGKLNTLIKDKTGRNKEVLRIFVENGAPEHILYDSKPHIGTDVLSKTVANMRNKMLAWGALIHYESTVTDFVIEDDRLTGLVINNKEHIPVESVILAIGHSARDTFETLYQKQVPMEAKNFAVGMRVQHPQELIDYSQYGRENDNRKLPSAAYKLADKTSVNRGVYSFCMCPGGYVVNASSEEGKLAVNGMSYSGRDSGIANSAIIVSVTKEDFESDHPLAGVAFQRELEQKAYELGKGLVPIQYYHEFKGKSGKCEHIKQAFEPCIKGGYSFADLKTLFSESVYTAFVEGMTKFGRVIPGFDDDFCILAGVESRTSSPVRITRNADCESAIKGLYPCGEGAGYAGGITSAAMDGLVIAEAISKKYKID